MKKIIIPLLAFVVLVAVVTVGASFYMLNFSLSPDPNRTDLDSAYTRLYQRMPDMKPWVDSMQSHGLLRDTFLNMPSGERHHALISLPTPPLAATPVLVHANTGP